MDHRQHSSNTTTNFGPNRMEIRQVYIIPQNTFYCTIGVHSFYLGISLFQSISNLEVTITSLEINTGVGVGSSNSKRNPEPFPSSLPLLHFVFGLILNPPLQPNPRNVRKVRSELIVTLFSDIKIFVRIYFSMLYP